MPKTKAHRFLPFIICGFASLFYVYDYFIQVSPAVMTHQLMQTYHIGAAGLGILGSIFFYAYAGMQIPAGMLLDKFGARKFLSLAIFISGLGVLLFGFTNSFILAGASRFMVGFGSAFSFIGALYLAANWFDHSRFALIAGIIQFAGCMGSIFGEAPLARAVNHFGFRQVLIAIAIITFILSLIFWLVIRDKPKQHQAVSKLDNTASIKKISVILAMPTVWWIALTGFLCWVPVASIGSLWGVPYLMQVYHWSNTEAAGFCSLFWLSMGVFSPIIGWFSDKIKRRKSPFYFCFILGCLGSFLFLFADQLPVYMTGIALVLIGIGPAIQALIFGIAKDILPDNTFGTAAGFINMVLVTGGGISQIVIGFILSVLWAHRYAHGVSIYSLYDYKIAMLIIPISLFLGIIVSYFKLPETYCRKQ